MICFHRPYCYTDSQIGLDKNKAKRIVLVSSSATKAAGVWDPSNLHGDIGYGRLKFYSNSKLYNVSDSLTNIN